jgi:FtsH-binding integral membrane protein
MANSVIYNRLFSKSKSKTMKGGSFNFNGLNLMNLIYKKKEFLILVFANLIAQLGITYYFMNKTDNPDIGFWPLFGIQIIIIFILALVPMPPIVKFLIFGVFSYTFGIALSHLKDKYDPVLIDIAIKGALSIFGLMMTLGVVLVGGGIHLGYKFGAFLFWALLALIIARLINMVGPQLSAAKKAFAYIGLGLFSLFVVYDTNQILSRDYAGDFITASMDYYLDILNLFTNLLSLNDN